MEDTNPSGQRLIGRDFHVRFGARLLAIIIAGVMAIAVVLYLIILKNPAKTYLEAKYNIYRTKMEIFSLIFESYYTAAILGLIALAVVVICIRFSHRIAGPMYRLEKSIDALGEGDLTVDIKFRTYDALGPIAGEINAAVRRLNHKVRSCQDALELIGKGEERVAELLRHERSNADEIRKAVGVIKDGLEELKAAIDTVKTGE